MKKPKKSMVQILRKIRDDMNEKFSKNPESLFIELRKIRKKYKLKATA
ncbi:MAG: hypothetical protein HGB12_11500 [Bacteroidetes bacterium]|nr:hypothetical protein [Bacteroidota bacterium]